MGRRNDLSGCTYKAGSAEEPSKGARLGHVPGRTGLPNPNFSAVKDLAREPGNCPVRANTRRKSHLGKPAGSSMLGGEVFMGT